MGFRGGILVYQQLRTARTSWSRNRFDPRSRLDKVRRSQQQRSSAGEEVRSTLQKELERVYRRHNRQGRPVTNLVRVQDISGRVILNGHARPVALSKSLKMHEPHQTLPMRAKGASRVSIPHHRCADRNSSPTACARWFAHADGVRCPHTRCRASKYSTGPHRAQCQASRQ